LAHEIQLTFFNVKSLAALPAIITKTSMLFRRFGFRISEGVCMWEDAKRRTTMQDDSKGVWWQIPQPLEARGLQAEPSLFSNFYNC